MDENEVPLFFEDLSQLVTEIEKRPGNTVLYVVREKYQEEIVLKKMKKMPIVFAGILSCQHHRNVDILSDFSICWQINKTYL